MLLLGVGLSIAPATPQTQDASILSSALIGGAGTDDCDVVALGRGDSVLLGCHSDSESLPTGASGRYLLQGDADAFLISVSWDGSEVGYLG